MSVREKADRLLTTGAVHVLADAAVVTGDHDEYRLYRNDGRWRCTCPARKRCSHIEAVERVTS